MNLKDTEQRRIIEEIRNGNNESRDKFILVYYERIKNNLINLEIPEEYHEDLLHDAIIALIDALYEVDFNKYQHVSQVLNITVVNSFAKSLGNIYKYEKEVNGKKFYKPSLYLYELKYSGLRKHNYSGYELVREYLNDGYIDEEIIEDSVTSDRVVEDLVIDKMLEEEYWKFVNSFPDVKQEIIKCRYPIYDYYAETGDTIAKITGYSKSYVMAEAQRLQRKIEWNKELRGYLK